MSRIEVEGILFVADKPDKNGNVFSARALRSMADGRHRFWDEKKQALIYRGPLPEWEQIKERNYG